MGECECSIETKRIYPRMDFFQTGDKAKKTVAA